MTTLYYSEADKLYHNHETPNSTAVTVDEAVAAHIIAFQTQFAQALPHMKSFSEMVDELMVNRNWNEQTFMDETGLSRSTYWNLKRHEQRNWQYKVVMPVIAGLKVPPAIAFPLLLASVYGINPLACKEFFADYYQMMYFHNRPIADWLTFRDLIGVEPFKSNKRITAKG